MDNSGHSQNKLDDSLQAIAGVYLHKSNYKHTFKTPQEMLIRTFKYITDYLQTEFTFRYIQEENTDALLDRLVKAAKLRSRKINLEEKWWQYDNGPLLAFYKDQPCALIPKMKGGYELISFLEEKPLVVDKKVSKFLNEKAYCFYRTFNNELKTFKDVIKFSMQGLGITLKKIFMLQTFVSIVAFIIPISAGMLFDIVIPSSDLNLLGQFACVLLVTSLILLLLELAQTFLVINLRFKFQINLQPALWDRILKLPLHFFKEYQAGDLTFRTNGLNTIQELVSQPILLTIIRGTVSLVSLLLMFYYSAILSLFAVISLIVISVVAYILFSKQLKFKRLFFHYASKESGTVYQLITGIVNFRVPHAEDKAFKLWSDYFVEKSKAEFKAGKYETFYERFNNTIIVFNTIGLFYLVYWIGIGDKLSFGNFIAFNSAFTLFFQSIFTLLDSLFTIIDVVPLAERMRPLLEEQPLSDENRAEPHLLQGKIMIKDLVFRYDKFAAPIYKNLSLEVNPGEVVGIVGPSGGGKSTLFRLLLGLEDPEEGDIFYDGVNLRMLKLGSLRLQLGVVSQKSVLFAGSIFANITSNNPKFNRRDAWDIAEKVNATEMIRALPMEMETFINEGMQTLSGGEAQRIILARALIKKPNIILLDEATSALDNTTQANVNAYLKELKSTQIIIAHRLSTLTHADRIYVIDKGTVVQSGTYTELLDQSGLFSLLAKRQLT